MAGTSTQVFIRNPQTCIKECVEVGVYNIAWDRGYIRKNSVDPTKFANVYFDSKTPYRMLAIGDQGTAEMRPGYTMKRPFAVYPTWEYGEDSADLLEELLKNPVGQDADLCSDPGVPRDERPVFGQEHRVVIIRPPDVRSGHGRQLIRLLIDLQTSYPESIIHVHGLWAWSGAFGHGWKSVDIEPRFNAQKGRVTLPMGKEVTFEQTRGAPLQRWVELLGFKPADLEVPRNRCMFNIKSALWAAQHYGENLNFTTRGKRIPDTTSPVALPATAKNIVSTAMAVPGDKIICDTCSLQNTCKYYRSGGVCSIPDSEPAPLARFFHTRDSNQIIEGLGTLLAAEVGRLERGMEDENLDGELDPEVTKILNTLFDRGVKLAKLVNPALAAAGAPKFGLQVNVGGEAAVSANALTSSVIAQLEAQGIPRAKITPEMIMAVIQPAEPIEVQSRVQAVVS
jgi:hypothetical protein